MSLCHVFTDAGRNYSEIVKGDTFVYEELYYARDKI
jgi:hypothetical protein